jgi:hypothetical protein
MDLQQLGVHDNALFSLSLRPKSNWLVPMAGIDPRIYNKHRHKCMKKTGLGFLKIVCPQI